MQYTLEFRGILTVNPGTEGRYADRATVLIEAWYDDDPDIEAGDYNASVEGQGVEARNVMANAIQAARALADVCEIRANLKDKGNE